MRTLHLRVRDNALLPGKHRRLRTIRHMELAQNITHMALHRLFCDTKLLRNRTVRISMRHQAQYLQLSLAQVGKYIGYIFMPIV